MEPSLCDCVQKNSLKDECVFLKWNDGCSYSFREPTCITMHKFMMLRIQDVLSIWLIYSYDLSCFHWQFWLENWWCDIAKLLLENVAIHVSSGLRVNQFRCFITSTASWIPHRVLLMLRTLPKSTGPGKKRRSEQKIRKDVVRNMIISDFHPPSTHAQRIRSSVSPCPGAFQRRIVRRVSGICFFPEGDTACGSNSTLQKNHHNDEDLLNHVSILG